MRISPIDISGGSLLPDNIRQKAPMMLFSREQSPFSLLREYGNPGRHPNAKFSCGLLLITDVGRRTNWQGGVFLIWSSAFSVTSMRRIFTIFL
jgi:hypothetical protein